MAKKSSLPEFVGWVAEDYLAEILVEMRRANAMSAGLPIELTHDDTAGAEDMEKVLTLSADVRRKREPSTLDRVQKVNAENEREKAKP
jgi:hypothetical protein